MSKSKMQFMYDNNLVSSVMVNVKKQAYRFTAFAASNAASKIGRELMPETKGGANYFGWYNITGNMAESVGITVSGYRDGRTTTAINFAPFTYQGFNRKHIRPSLGKGEPFDSGEWKKLPSYHNGYVFQPNKVYKGRLPYGGLTGSQERRKFIEQYRASGVGTRGIFHVVAFIAMPYSRYVEAMHHIHICSHMAYVIFSELKKTKKWIKEFQEFNGEGLYPW